jgi:prepilin-type N-terminal cleavage/methylation domain-containing protein
LSDGPKPKLRTSENGFTLIELLVAMALALFIGAAAMTFFVVTFEQQNDISSRTVATNQAEQGLEALVRDLREATTGLTISTSGTTTTMSFNIPAPGTAGVSSDAVVWTCTDNTTVVGNCTRVLTTSGGTITKTEIAGVQSLSLTAYSSNDPPAVVSPVSNATNVSAVGITLDVQITNYDLGYGTKTTAASGDTNPIVLQTTADLQNFG